MKSTYDINCYPDNSPVMVALKKILRIKSNIQLHKFNQLEGRTLDQSIIIKSFTPTTKKFYIELKRIGVNENDAIFKTCEAVHQKQNLELKAFFASSFGLRLDVTFNIEEVIK
ncbi:MULTISPECIES: hypothetical protein [unclassified Colwellia]|uniref:hypothetical protein n=1 Tax=unclassified Colwellia TaxID=196834 RepID=UPI0015F440E8|nr:MULTISPECIES: hypothetical protein [unclassified Colwellia]MBA6379682.1 hypothetical protein [Colwellia sp. BRX10-7]MBA6388503.1 hypothetical protein [Colwellia sp. BRX10-2]MBA6402983.1 hypothetical protein [Colwellia sp. BRX10-5]MBA6406300.1 hypothetical protein [Colwellia sp. BRX10-1]